MRAGSHGFRHDHQGRHASSTAPACRCAPPTSASGTASITDIGRLSGAKRDDRRRRAGRHARHRRRAHALRSAAHLRAVRARRRASTASPRWSPATAATRSRRARRSDHDWLTALFAKVEGMTPSVLEQGLPWDWDSFPSLPRRARHAPRHQPRLLRRPLGAAPLRHGRGRLGARRHRRRDRSACSSWCARRCAPAPPASRRRTAPTHVDQFKRPVPSRHADLRGGAALIEAAGEGGAGSICFLPETAARASTSATAPA